VTAPLSERALARLLAIGADDPEPVPLPARYRIVRELGRGGMGVVYEADDLQLGRRCAVKCIGAAVGAADELRLRLQREALAAARLRHPHIAAVYDATPDYISMQLIAGGPIDALPADRRLHVELVRDAALAVHHAHEQGIVHRDLKPSNLLVEGRHVFVVDFGLAKEIGPLAAPSLPGVLLGTPAFMPPEQAQGRAVDARSDVYALGATLQHCLCGAPPFAGDSLPELLRAIVEDEPEPAGIEADLDLVLLKCLAKEPQRRYASARELADDLDRWLRSEPVQARRPSIGYRLHKLLQRRRQVLRAAAVAGLLMAAVLVPIALRESAARVAANAAGALSDHAAAVLQDAEVFRRLGDLPSAHQALDSGIEQARAFLARHDVPRVHHLLSRLLRARGQGDLALLELQLARAGDPDLDEARFEHGLVLAAEPGLGDADRALAIAELGAPIRQRSVLTNVELLFGRAELHRLQGNTEQARQELEEVLAYDVGHVAARTSLAHVALAMGDLDLARHVSASAVDLQLGFGPVYLAREQRQLPTAILGLDAALVDLGPLLAAEPDMALAMARRGLVQLRRAVRLAGEGSSGEAAAAVQAAIEDHDAMLQLHAECAGAFNNRGVCLLQAERLFTVAGDTGAAVEARQRAEADFARALALAPELVETHFNAGLLALHCADICAGTGRVEAATSRRAAAVVSLQRALALAPADWPFTRACRGKLATAAGRPGG
jgi:tetratricopeptide (TPR) repeat protein/predicted Ser/Thr protein kinase